MIPLLTYLHPFHPPNAYKFSIEPNYYTFRYNTFGYKIIKGFTNHLTNNRLHKYDFITEQNSNKVVI